MLPTRAVTRSALAVLALTLVGCSDDLGLPEDHLLSDTTQLVQYQTCAQLEHDLEDQLIREVWVQIDRVDWYGPDFAEDGGGAPTSGDNGGGREEGTDYSGTNNQEAGVDEADLVKTDGYHLYALNGNRLHIFGVPEFGQLVPESVTPIEGHPRELLLDKDAGRAVVFSYVYVHALPVGHPLRALTGYQDDDNGWYWRADVLTKLTVLDVSDRTAPELVREVYYEGWYQTARKIDSSVRVATYAHIDNGTIGSWWQVLHDSGYDRTWTKLEMRRRIRALSLADLIPQLFVRDPNGVFEVHGLSQQNCRAFYRPTDSHARGIASILSFDLLGATLSFDADHVVANWATFYASRDKLVLAEPAHDWWWYWYFENDPDQLNVHVFDISQPGQSHYAGSGRVLGQLSDQFAIDEHEGRIRLATTTNIFRGWWGVDDSAPPEMENHVWVLRQAGTHYLPVGHVGGIALGERITAARFLDDKGYLVTFRQIDPLFTIDLSDPDAPQLVGELKIPGFSTYLHPLGTERLLTIGVGGDEQGANWRTTISTFDVSDFANPTLTAALPIVGEQGWGWSEALSEHKAFQYFAPKRLLAVPQSNYEHVGNGYYRYLSKLEVIEVNPDTGALAHKGAIDHTPYYATDQYWSYLDIRRSVFMGDYLYAISDKAITVHRTTDLGQVTAQPLPGYTPGSDYWWW